jgi:hypothetical protein
MVIINLLRGITLLRVNRVARDDLPDTFGLPKQRTLLEPIGSICRRPRVLSPAL